MKFLFSLFFFALSIAATAQELIRMPEATVYNANGKAVLTTAVSDGVNPTVLITYATKWAPTSVDLLDDLSALYVAEQPKSGVKIVAVNCENTRNTNEVMMEAANHNWNSFEVLHDQTHHFMDVMKAHTAPLVFFLDANGIIIYCVQSCNLTAGKIYEIAVSIKNKKITAENFYLDADWFPCEKSAAIYYRKIVKDSTGKFLVTDYFMNGQIQMQGICTLVYPQCKNGIFTFYYESGQVKQRGYYRNDKKTGLFYDWNKDGTYQSKTNYFDDKKDGASQEFYPNGAIESEGSYFQGIQDDNWKTYYENGKVKEQTLWNKGMEVWSTGWYDNGLMKYKVPSFKNNLPEHVEAYYNNGQRINLFIYDRDSNITEIKQFYESGELKSSGKLSDNNTWSYTEYYAGGKQKMKFTLNSETKLDGKFQEWHENGKKKTEMEFSDGKAVNNGMAWYDNGQLKEKNNFKTAVQVFYSADGKKQPDAKSELETYNTWDGQYELFSLTVNYYLNVLSENWQ
jgi:antitoxin component YwqK of YwqJK toxin-antitoxin module